MPAAIGSATDVLAVAEALREAINGRFGDLSSATFADRSAGAAEQRQ
ncbi:hypothetical protein [Streptomyces vastus]